MSQTLALNEDQNILLMHAGAVFRNLSHCPNISVTSCAGLITVFTYILKISEFLNFYKLLFNCICPQILHFNNVGNVEEKNQS
jgi:hypothetical protein